MGEVRTEQITLWGIVQGVGFRPFVAKTAHALGMKGQVRNLGGLVELHLTDRKERIDCFLETIQKEKPLPAEIVHIKREKLALQSFADFTILDSGAGEETVAMLPADLALCPDCLAEMRNPKNLRYQHPFISCMVCGPRYTIVDRIPYDRHNTTMIDFPMCAACQKEYTALSDRRYHAQTISCHQCGPQLHHSIAEGVACLQKGEVIAFKATGGYNLVCNPLDDRAVAKLRRIKGRQEKPFAFMFKDIEEVKTYCHVDAVEEKLLRSAARPIVLLEHKPHPSKEIAKSRFIGAFLPSVGAQYLLLDHISPLIFTSANFSDQPMIATDRAMETMLGEQPDIKLCLSNERRIQVQMDDSVTRVIDGQPQMIRRSKGYAPVPLYVETENPREFLALGGQLKNAFAMNKGAFAYMSQYFGDLDCPGNQRLYRENLDRMAHLFHILPQGLVCDLHPGYFTTELAKTLAAERELPLLQVQHHHAHVASVMAEHNLKGKVIGISFDGTGYGTDGAVLGGEFLLCEEGTFQRINHLRYVEMLGGDSSVREGWKSALCYQYAAEQREKEAQQEPKNRKGILQAEREKQEPNNREEVLQGERETQEFKNRKSVLQTEREKQEAEQEGKMPAAMQEQASGILVDLKDILDYARRNRTLFNESNQPRQSSGTTAMQGQALQTSIRKRTAALQLTQKALEQGINTIRSSSMGRLFDAVSALLGIQDYNHYEGQCAMLLEDAAARALQGAAISDADHLALDFHRRIAQMILSQCQAMAERYNTTQVALTGGVFQNKILMEESLRLLREHDFQPYYNISVSPNDGGIALGQLFIAQKEATGWQSIK